MTICVKAGRSAPKPLNRSSNCGNDEYQQNDGHDHRHHQHRRRIEQGLLDLLLDRLALLLVGGDLVEQALERAGLLARLDQVDEQIVEIQRMLGQRLVQRGAALDIGLDVEYQLLHRAGFSWPGADDLERLHQRNAGSQHGGELAAEDRDIFGLDACRRILNACDCFLMRVATTPWRRNSLFSA